ncbi:Tyrosine recombinase XerC [subsurface metagenome]
MNTVDPIKQPNKILAIKRLLMADPNPRNYLLFTFGINSALRSGDLRNLKVADVLDERGDIKKYLYMRIKKTGREMKITINEAMREALKYFISKAKVYSPNQYLFKSKRSDKPLSNVDLFYLMKNWTQAVGLINERYSAHSLRKTWGYQARKFHGASIDMISEKLGHASSSVTKRYIGIDQEEINEMEEKICI